MSYFKRKSKRPNGTRFRDLADKEWQIYVQSLAKNKCTVCGKQSQVSHHFAPKSVSNRLRYDVLNGVSLCNGCHMRHHQAGDPIIHGTVMKQRGMDWYEYIEKSKGQIVKVNVEFYKGHYERLRTLNGTPL